MAGSVGDRFDVLELTLQHAKDALGVHEVCALLCVDQATAAATAQHFRAQLTVQFSPCSLQQAEHFTQWLVKHVGMVNFLDFEPSLPWDPSLHEGPPPSVRGLHNLTQQQDRHSRNSNCRNAKKEKRRGALLRDDAMEDNAAAGSLLARGLCAAAAGKVSQLNTLHCCSWEATGPPLLQALPTSLTALQLSWSPLTSDWLDMDPTRVLDEAIARLTGLLSLKLCLCSCGTQEEWGPSPGVFSSLTRLTELELPGFCCMTVMVAELPPSLQRLTLSSLLQPEDDSPVAEIIVAHCAHLTALTELRTGSQWCAGDVLPPNLVRLYDEVNDFSLLLGLKGLQHLEASWWADELCQLAKTATGLTHVNLCHDCAEPDVSSYYDEDSGEFTFDGGLRSAVDALLGVGVADAVRGVHLLTKYDVAGCFGPPLLQPLAGLTNLNSLKIGNLELSMLGMQELSSLCAISKLDLWSCEISADVLRRLPDVLAKLPLLHWLCLPQNIGRGFPRGRWDFTPFFNAVAGQDCRLPQLRHLTIGKFADPLEQAELQWVLRSATQLTELRWLPGPVAAICRALV